MPCSLFAVTFLTVLSIASCNNDQAHQQARPEDTVHRSWKMGGRGERKSLSRAAFYCKHYLADTPAFSWGSGWVVLSSKYILLEWQRLFCLLRATDLTWSRKDIWHSLILVLSPPTVCSALLPEESTKQVNTSERVQSWFHTYFLGTNP